MKRQGPVMTYQLVTIASSLMLLVAVLAGAAPNEEAVPPEAAPSVGGPVPEPSTGSGAGEVQERAVIRDHRANPGIFTPSQTAPPPMGQPAPKVLVPGITGPTTGTLALPDRYAASTVNLTKIANALQLRHKSLSMLITAPPGIAVTNPVNIKVTYNSSSSGSRWRQALYNPASGYRDFQNDPEGNRYLRHMTLDILLTEQQPGNQFVNFAIKWEIDLDPLFDVTISPLRFKLNGDCDRIGKSEIRLSWTSPDTALHKKGFSMSKGNTVTINEFAWARQEVGASANLLWPQWGFYEDDPVRLSGAYLEGFGPQTLKFLPTTVTGYVGRTIKESRGQSCTADIAFNVTVKVRQYLNL